ncbi:MAG TPA: TatD family hydrolase [Candidatus Eisenbacteria bacterium]|nr:TatD family hydrolase [Candidatus Eisenbacteria bacterium]
MVNWFDTHCHLQAGDFNNDRATVFKRAEEAGVKYILLSTSYLEDSRSAVDLALEYKNVYCSIGFHPHEAKRWNDSSADKLKKLYQKAGSKAKKLNRDNPVKAIGETGLDYYRDNSPRNVQKQVYREHILLAYELQLPLIIHERQAFQESYQVLRWAYENKFLLAEAGVAHCFSGSWESAQLLMAIGFSIGLDGPVTFKNAKRPKEIAKKIPLDKLLLETDAPYLTPEPKRGKRNESSYLPYIGEEIARLRQQDVATIAKETLKNGKRVFSIK